MSLAIWLLQNENAGYDDSAGYVVVAKNGETARVLVSEYNADEANEKRFAADDEYEESVPEGVHEFSRYRNEDRSAWLTTATCVQVGWALPEQTEGVLLEDYRAG